MCGGILLLRRQKTLFGEVLLITGVLFLLGMIAIPTYGVHVVKEEQVGIYEVTVIKSDGVQDIIDWLNDNGFRFSDDDYKVFESYVRDGWVFVTARIGSDASHKSHISTEGLLDPLVMTFETEQPVYPLTLTGTGQQSTEIVLYVWAAHKMTTDERMKLAFAERLELKGGHDELMMIRAQTNDAQDETPRTNYLTKFRAKLLPEDMQEDLIFKQAPDDSNYRETMTPPSALAITLGMTLFGLEFLLFILVIRALIWLLSQGIRNAFRSIASIFIRG